MDVSEGLNEQQKIAVEHLDGPQLVVAGAGTGKTAVITRRIAYLIAQGHAKPTEILALTFTDKAAREMADRLYSLIGWQSFSVAVMTFNAFGSAVLGEYASHIGRSTRGGLINDTQKALLLQQRFDEIDLKYYGLQSDIFEFMTKMVGYIGKLQNAGITTHRYRKYVDGLAKGPSELHATDILEQQDLVAIYELYETIKRDTATFDYYDQLALPLHILQQRPNLAARLSARYKFVLVDEYQDTSPVQDALLRCIVPPDGNLFAVGDDDQAIYGFRGADIANILRYTEHFNVERPLALIQNYRSGQPILDASYRLIKGNDPERLESKLKIDKRLIAQTAEATVIFRPYGSPVDEQTGVVTDIASRISTGQKPGEMAVLARSNATLRTYAKALRGREVPFAISTEVNIFEQRELINLWYLMEWIGHRASEEAIAHVVMGPFVGWKAAEWREIVELSTTNLTSIEETLSSLALAGDAAAVALMAKLNVWREWAAADNVSTLAYKVVFAPTGEEQSVADRLKSVAKSADGDGGELRVMRVFDDLARFYGQVEDYVTVQELAGGDQSLAGYLSHFPKPPTLEVSETAGDEDGVQLLTVHAAKGLEFDTVYVVNSTAKSWSEPPGMGGLEVPAVLAESIDLPPVHEQRRLMYVAATRARKELLLSAPVASAGGQRQTVSPLVEELLGEAPDLTIEHHEVDKADKLMQKLQRFYPLKAELPSRLPFERADGWIELGVGALERYELSPHDFYLQNVLKISQPFGPQLAFGSAIHGTIQMYYEGRLHGEIVTVDELLARLGELWSDRGYESRSQADLARQRADDTIRRFVIREATAERIIRSSEQSITLEIPEAKLRLRGRMDATFGVGSGLEIRDFKTGSLHDADKLSEKAKKSFQLRTYALAEQTLSGAAPESVTLDYVVTGVEGTARLTPAILKNHHAKLIDLAARLRARDFAPGAPSAFNQPAAYKYYGSEADGDGAL
jgi:DNA helicase-2/ATP-dependent DNA helicase PcrA